MDAVGQTALDDVAFLAHGTTVVINALTERKGAARRPASPPQGFRDVLEIAKGNRPDLYNFVFAKQPPFVPRHLRFEVRGAARLPGPRGGRRSTRRASASAVRAAARRRASTRSRSASCTPTRTPSTSGRRRRSPREWPDVDALRLAPAVGRVARVRPHLDDGARRLREADRPALPDAPLGPAARRRASTATPTSRCSRTAASSRFDVSGAGADQPRRVGPGRRHHRRRRRSARRSARPNLITFDVGGTTAKSSLVEGGELRLTADYHIDRDPRNAGYPLKVPVVDIIEIGMAGGSIAWIDAAGSLKVGPHSAVADPGPACYGRGGTEADADRREPRLPAGSAPPPSWAAGCALDEELRARRHRTARRAARHLASRSTARGILRIANASMVNLLRLVSIRRGRDPRDFALVACGGGGPLHGALLAAELKVPGGDRADRARPLLGARDADERRPP